MVDRPCYTVLGFCADHHLSRSFFYLLVKQGKAPRLMRVGKKILISAESAKRWRAKMEK